jgi:hypothetical protein
MRIRAALFGLAARPFRRWPQATNPSPCLAYRPERTAPA